MPYLNSLIFLISILLIICGIQALYLKRFWKQVKNIKLHNEQQLHSQEAYLQLFFEHANDCIAVFSLDNRIIDVNPAFEEVYGWTRSECVGKIIQLVPQNNDEAATNRYQQLLGGQSFKLLETQDMRKDGTVFDVEISLSPIYDHNKKMVAISVISRDISYKKENEKLIIQSEKLKLAGEIAAGVAHEIRNPMTVVSGFVQMMNSDKHSPYQHYTEIIQSEIERINLIISEFLVLSKPQADHIKELSIDKVLNDTINFFQLEFQNRSITFKKHFETSDYRVQGNENQLKQVFINIIKNAIEAIDTQQSIGKIDLSISKSEKNMLEISISDNGIGISEVLLPQIFEPFYTTKTKGTGLGMMITNKIIQEHNGTITVESRPQLGTSIKIKLPII
ncbi:MAG: ATP-binding protein [Lysinibacillus sp.]